MSAPELTQEQAFIVALKEGSHLVIAPPGSGKTEVLTRRIIRLLQDSAGETFRILALTFTTRAAEAMRSRIEAHSPTEWRRVTCATFHAFCLDVLQHYGDPLGVEIDDSIYEREEDRLEALVRGLQDDGLPVSEDSQITQLLRQLLASIGRLKRDLVPATAAPVGDKAGGISLRDAYLAYDRTLRRYGALDFDDLLMLTYRLLTEWPRVARHYRKIYRYILVDEAQDTSRAQYEILKALCGSEHRNVMMVADADQFIYRFLGASDRYLQSFQRDFGAPRYHLTNNFRCAAAIVQAANALISHNPDRPQPGQPMQPATRAQGHVEITSHEDEEAEARAVVDLIEEWLAVGLTPEELHPGEPQSLEAQDICVLGRARYLLQATVAELERRGLEHQFKSGEVGLFESSFFRFAYHALRVVTNPRDLLARENLLAECPGLSVEDTARLREMGSADLFQALATLAAPSQQELALHCIQILVQPMTPSMLVDSLHDISRKSAARNEAEQALQESDAATLRERWLSYYRRVAPEESSLRGFIAELSLTGRSAVDGKGVRVLTIHAAKGLEFRAVILVGMNEGSFPDFRNLQTPEAIAEERRNAYVAVTRAARRLHLTRPRTRRLPWGSLRAQEPSRFLHEMKLRELART